ncbi:MAG: hypothetical protein JXX28_15915 [Deltaproteobacteria bacterium]|nr:hypothetical protein [Deltaproteobacteria bacterium]
MGIVVVAHLVEVIGSGSATRYRRPVWADAGEALGEREQAVLRLVVARGQVGREAVCEVLGVSARTAQRVIAELLRRGLLLAAPRGRRVLYRAP